MNSSHGRPQLGEIYAPPRHILNGENAYLSNVGLVVLLRGSLSHNLPRLMAENLAEVHGGQPSDFTVAQASISPYLLICNNTDVRDAVVRGGIYSIPRTQIQYAVHEWRPRFGMSYNPTSHQVWVKIVGLPLQAWTSEQITGIIRSFGQPQHILPFGHAAGHFKDITALVATKSPAQIPLAYTYREGDYAARIEIRLLSWRLWDESPFPPPADNPNHQVPLPQPQNQAGPSSPQHRTPSSTASSAGSTEHSIDLSARSPRNWQIVLSTSQTSHPRAAHSVDAAYQPPLCEREVVNRPPQSPGTHRRRLPPTHGKSHTLATKNPTIPLTPNLSQSSHLARLTEAPHPIAITLPCSPWIITTFFLSLGEAREKSRTRGHCTVSFSPLLSIGIFSRQNTLEMSMRQQTVALNIEGEGSTGRHKILFKPSPLLLTGPSDAPLTENPHDAAQGGRSAQGRMAPILEDEAAWISPQPSNCHTQPYQPRASLQSPVSMDIDFSTPNSLRLGDTIPMDDTCAPLTIVPPPPAARNSKQRPLPTRRSQRILQKRPTHYTEQKGEKKSKTQSSKIPFIGDSHLTPLNVSKTLEILQASGLVINKQIEDLIEDAVKKDQAMEEADQSCPTTPLHDPIPPMAVPGSDILL